MEMQREADTHRYDDIINLPHPVSQRHPQMSMKDRAAQFAPFAALTGHDAAIRETARLTDRRMELDEDTKADLNQRLLLLGDAISENPIVEITYFEPDQKKAGGSYITAVGTIKRINDVEHSVVLSDGRKISIDEISEIQSEWFRTVTRL